MKIILKALIASTLVFALNASASTAQFCDGFERGYITGYKQARKTSMEPMTPMCPMQPMKKFGDPDSDYEQGYLMGLQRGNEKGSY